MGRGMQASQADKPIVMTIGRTSTNTIVLDQSNVSSQHARLMISGDEIILEDLGSTNGTSVGTVENKISKAKIQPTDTIFFGSSPYPVADLIAKAEQGTERHPQPVATPSSSVNSSSNNLIIVASAVAFAAILGLGWYFTRGNERIASNDPVVEDPSEPLPADNTDPDVLSLDELIERSLYVLVVANPEEETAFRVGTCFAIASQKLATTASVASAMKAFQQNGFPEAYLVGAHDSQQLKLQSTTIHPQYVVAQTQARAAQNEYDSIFNQVEAEPPQPDQIDAIEQKLLSAKVKAIEAMDRQSVFDVAVITTESKLPHWLSGLKKGSSLRPNLKLKIHGLAYDAQDPFFDPDEPLNVSSLTGRAQLTAKIADDVPPRMTARTSADHIEDAYVGSPVFGSQGEVIAVYSRPTPPQNDGENSEPSETFDAPLYDRVTECLTESFTP